jgi:hypothetical protein
VPFPKKPILAFKWEKCIDPNILVTTDKDFPVGLIFYTPVPNRYTLCRLMHITTLDTQDTSLWTICPIDIGQMFATMDEIKNSKETAILS